MTTDLVATSTITIDAPADRVWAALTSSRVEGVMLETDWRQGSPIAWIGEDFRDHGMILEIKPHTLLSHTLFRPSNGRQDVPENHHTLTYRLVEVNGRTTVTLTRDNIDGYDALTRSEEHGAAALEGLKSSVEP